MANRFENIPQSPKLYQEQSMYVPHEFIGTEVPKTPLLAPLDIYKKDISQKKENADKLTDDNSKFTADHIKIFGDEFLDIYGELVPFDDRNKVIKINEDFKNRANQILAIAPYDDSGAKKAMYQLKSEYLTNPDLERVRANVKQREIDDKILAESQNNPNIQNDPIFQKRIEAIKTGNLGRAAALPKNKIVESVDALRKGVDYDKVGYDGITRDEDYGITYITGFDGRSVSLDKAKATFLPGWENSPEMHGQALAEAKALGNKLSYNIDRTNKDFKERYLTKEEQKLPQKNQDELISKRLKNNSTLLEEYKSYIGYDSKDIPITGYIDDTQKTQLRSERINKNYNEVKNSELNRYINSFGKDQKFSMSNINWNPYNDGTGNKYQPKNSISSAAILIPDKFGLQDIINVDSGDIREELLRNYDGTGKFIGSGENPLSTFSSEIENSLKEQFSPSEYKSLQEVIGKDPTVIYAAMQKLANKGALEGIKEGLFGGDGSAQKVNEMLKQLGDRAMNIDEVRNKAINLNQSLNKNVKNDYERKAVSFNIKQASPIIKNNINQLIQVAGQSAMFGQENNRVSIIENGKERKLDKEEIDYFNRNGVIDSENMTVQHRDGKTFITTTLPFISKESKNNEPTPKTVSLEIDRNDNNSNGLLVNVIKAQKTQDDLSGTNKAIEALTTAYGEDQKRISKAFTTGGSKKSPEVFNFSNGSNVVIEYIKNKNDYYVPTVVKATGKTKDGKIIDYLKYNKDPQLQDILLISVPDQYSSAAGFNVLDK